MDCCHCQSIETAFDQKYVEKELARYRREGAKNTTRLLLEGLKAAGVEGMTLLDIGGGVGAISNALFEAGLRGATEVEASSAYLQAAKEEAARQGHGDRVSYQHGDLVDVAANIPPADIVTLDRVICCYPDMQALVSLSAARAGKLYGVVYPRDTWWVKFGLIFENLANRLNRGNFRVFAHPTRAVQAIIESNGLKQRFARNTIYWQVVVYSR